MRLASAGCRNVFDGDEDHESYNDEKQTHNTVHGAQRVSWTSQRMTSASARHEEHIVS